ncbi:hypothetical protein M2232_002337 [Bradyrhizobium japonicum]|nr:hypothetical protein [Bradyrhizobium japonicum]MCW2343419.1 hypothetical protein [Bradyrhizobium japonicum]
MAQDDPLMGAVATATTGRTGRTARCSTPSPGWARQGDHKARSGISSCTSTGPRYHIAYPQAADALKHLGDHLSALAFCEGSNQRAAGGAPEPVYKR